MNHIWDIAIQRGVEKKSIKHKQRQEEEKRSVPGGQMTHWAREPIALNQIGIHSYKIGADNHLKSHQGFTTR